MSYCGRAAAAWMDTHSYGGDFGRKLRTRSAKDRLGLEQALKPVPSPARSNHATRARGYQASPAPTKGSPMAQRLLSVRFRGPHPTAPENERHCGGLQCLHPSQIQNHLKSPSQIPKNPKTLPRSKTRIIPHMRLSPTVSRPVPRPPTPCSVGQSAQKFCNNFPVRVGCCRFDTIREIRDEVS